jgi:predicted TIM-barrel fold metal-dependent hydrolase
VIIDVHTHIWQSPDQLGQMDLGEVRPIRSRARASGGSGAGGAGAKGSGTNWRPVPSGDPDYHWAQSGAVDKSIVLGFKSRYLRAEIPNRYVADYVSKYPQKLIGFAGIDPTEPGATEEVKIAKEDLRLRGITLSPANQDFHPTDSRAMRVYEAAERFGMPILIRPSGQFTEESKLEFGRPYLLDEVARTFPKLRLVIAQLGQPWVDETICMLGKHPNVFADVSGLLSRPWQAYNALVSCYQADVIDKLLFGSDFPYTNAEECIESLYRINQLAQGTNLPVVPREALRGIVERDAIGLLGLG